MPQNDNTSSSSAHLLRKTCAHLLHAVNHRGAALAFVGLSLCAWTAMLLAGLGLFQWILPLLIAAVGGMLYLRSCSGKEEIEPASGRWGLAAWGVAGLSLLLSSPPSEMLLGGWDPGVYTHIAASMNREGSLLFPAEDFLEMDAETLRLFSRDVGNARQPFHGMYLRPDGRLSPQFFHLFPSLMAVFYGMGGLRTALMLNALLQAGSVLMMFHLLRRLVGAPQALAGALLMALHPVQIWQAGFPTAELLTQLLLLFGCDFLLGAAKSKSPRPALLAGFAFGLAFMCRYDVILFLVPFVLLILLFQLLSPAPRFLLWTLPGLLLTGLHVWLHLRFVAPYYHPLSYLVVPALLAVLLFILLLAALRMLLPRFAQALGGLLFRLSTPLASAFYLIWIFFTGYLRPRLFVDGRVRQLFDRFWPGNVDALVNANIYNMERLGAVFGAPALLLGLAGILLLILRARRPEQKALLYSALAFMAVMLYDVFHDQFMMWMMRRFLPVVIPLLCVGVVISLQALAQQVRRLSRPGLRPLLTALLLLITFLPMLPATRQMRKHRDWPGLAAWLDSVRAALPDDAVLFSDQPGFAAPFRFLYGLRAYTPVLRSPGERQQFEASLARAAAREKSVFLLSMRAPPDMEGLIQSAQHSFPLRSSELTHPRRSVPRERRSRGGDFVLYEFTGVSSEHESDQP